MTYTPRPGDIGLTQISGAGGRWIRRAQWAAGDGYADFEHAFVVGPVGGDGTSKIIEAMPGGARQIRNWHDPERTRYLICPDRYREAVAHAARDLTGVPYSWADYGALALHRFHIPAPHLRRYIASSGHMICSQLADHAARVGGWHLYADGRWPGYVTPGDLHKLWEYQQGGGRWPYAGRDR